MRHAEANAEWGALDFEQECHLWHHSKSLFEVTGLGDMWGVGVWGGEVNGLHPSAKRKYAHPPTTTRPGGG